ncbi:hypothetical protein [Deinococcus hopiensis]|uniref:hypothetical protein n=1 Tax=Deinococcus hopiensis TaxID=309885 RepID=UPI001483293A|nr:hypothetical protein [Deinococcus hopiensis]
MALADDFGCHEEATAEAWEAWQSVLEGHDMGDAEFWLRLPGRSGAGSVLWDGPNLWATRAY